MIAGELTKWAGNQGMNGRIGDTANRRVIVRHAPDCFISTFHARSSAEKQTYIQRNHFYDIIKKINMPKKIRDLIRDLEKAGFINRGGKGSHK
jgi:hypothetical protein